MSKNNFLPSGGGYYSMELVLAFAWITLITIVYIVSSSRKK